MPGTAQTDAMIARLESDLEERMASVEGLIAQAQDANRDLNKTEMDLVAKHQERIEELNGQLEPLRTSSKMAIESRNRMRQVSDELQTARRQGLTGDVEYRSAGAFIAEMYYAGMGDAESQKRLEVFNRAAAHQTTADNPGLLPEQIVQPVLSFVDAGRPLVTALGPQDLGQGAWAYARITQHTQVAQQTAEKTELASRQMVVTKTPISAPTFGGYVNVSRQDIQRTTPGIVDMVIKDLASEYAIETEAYAADVLNTAATVSAVTIPNPATAEGVNQAIWAAVGQSWEGTRGVGRPIVAVSPDMLGVVGPLYPSVNPINSSSPGFSAGAFGQGPGGTISGLTVVMSQGLPAGTVLVLNTAATKCFEDRYGSMQVQEPSVWGVQVGYAGDFQTIVVEPSGVIKINQAAAA